MGNTSLHVSWEAPIGGANGYVVAYSTGSNQLSPKDISSTETTLLGLSPSVYNITVYAYKDIPSVASDTVSILLDGSYNLCIIYNY